MKEFQNYVELITMNKKLEELPDKETQQAIIGFVNKQTVYKSKNQFLTFLCKIFPGVSIRKFTAKVLVDFMEYWEIHKKTNNSFSPVKSMTMFLFYAVENNYIEDRYVRRLADFKEDVDLFPKNKNWLIYIMTHDDYELFRNSDLFAERYKGVTLSVYSFEIDKDIELNNTIKSAVETYIKGVKFERDVKPWRKYQLLFSTNRVCRELFYAREFLDYETLLEYVVRIKSVSDKEKYQKLQVCWELIEHLYEAGVSLDKTISHLAKLNAHMKNHLKHETMIAILESEHPDYWMAGTYSDGGNFVYFFNHSEADIRNLLLEFTIEYGYKSDTGLNKLLNEFETSLGAIKIERIKDFSFSTCVQQIKYFYARNSWCSSTTIQYLLSFYYYINENVYSFLEKDGIPSAVFHRFRLASELASGYELVKYNQLEPVPSTDKWVLFFKKYDRDTYIRSMTLSFIGIESCIYRDWAKQYIWKADILITNKIHAMACLKNLLNYLSELKTGKALSIFTNPGKEAVISVNDIAAVKNFILAKDYSERSKSELIYHMRSLLLFVEREKLGKIETGVFYQLTYSTNTKHENAKPIPEEHLQRLSVKLRQNAEKNTIDAIYQSIFYIGLETEFRVSQIVDLNKDCLQETAKKNEYVLVSETKTSSWEVVEQPVSEYVEREIRHIISMTEAYRDNCKDPTVVNKLFIKPGRRKGAYNKVAVAEFNKYLKKCCETLGLPSYTTENLRDTHITKAEEFKIRKSLSDYEQNVLSGHTSTAMDDIHYVKLSIKDMLEALNGVIIGDIKLDGTIITDVDSTIANVENEVENGCGWCKSPVCGISTNLDCLLCPDFVTTISRLPYFEEQVKVIDHRIEKATIPHDKEDLVNTKRLFLRYIEEILKKKETIENDGK